MSFASKIAIPQSLSFIFKKRRLLNRIIILLFALIALSLWFQWNNNLQKPEALARNRVKAMMKHAWSGYYKYARGSDELLPLSQTGYNWTFRSMQFTPVDSMDSLIIMDLMKEYEQAKELVLQYDFDQIDYPINHFETNIRVLGGLLAANDLRPDVRFVKLAEDLGMRLLKAFDTPTGIPLQFIDLKNGSQRKGGSFLACAGTLQLEFQYLSDLTGKTIFQDKALYVLEQLQFMEKPIPGLFPVDIDSDHLRFGAEAYGIAANADSFYEYLLKMYLATGTEKFKTWYEVAANVFSVNKAVVNNLLIKEGKYWYLPDFRFGYHGNEFHHLVAYR